MSNTPQIRFAGFTDAWEQRKFSDFTFPAGERNKDDLDLEPYAITNNQGFIAQSEAHDDFGYMKDVDRKMYIVVKPNSFAYNPARINVGSLGYYEGAENVIVSSLYEVFQTAEYVDDKFLKHWFKTKAFQDWIERLQEGSVRLYFYYDKLCECVMSMPSVEEQRKIGAYLDKLDNLITLHQREYFSFDFDSQSAIIAQNTFSWEQRKLENITSLITKGTTPKDKSGNGEVNFIKVENIDPSSGIISSCSRISLEEHEGYLKRSQLKENDILFSIAGTLGRTSVVNKGILPANTNQALAILRVSEGDISYLVTVLSGRAVSDFIKKNPTVGAQPNLSLEQVSNLEIPYPSIEEQQKIGDYFRNLDDLITLHQHKPNKKGHDVLTVMPFKGNQRKPHYLCT